MRFEETGANTGVFTSEDGNDESNIRAMGSENDDFTIDYADADVQVFIESFDSILELIADGTWDAGESLTIRVTDEDIDLNTLNDYDMTIGDDDLPPNKSADHRSESADHLLQERFNEQPRQAMKYQMLKMQDANIRREHEPINGADTHCVQTRTRSR